MQKVRAHESARIDAPPERVYPILADYGEGHRRILPERYFSGLEVERGGRGEGTVIHVRMTPRGGGQSFRADVREPEPGRVLVEAIRDARGTTTSFTVDPLEGGRASRVTIATEWESPAWRAWIERLLAPPLLRRIYREELGNLAREATAPAASPHEPRTTRAG